MNEHEKRLTTLSAAKMSDHPVPLLRDIYPGLDWFFDMYEDRVEEIEDLTEENTNLLYEKEIRPDAE